MFSFGFAKWVVVVVSVTFYPVVTAQTENLSPPPPPGGYPLDTKVNVSPTMAIILICLIITFFVVGCASVYVRQCIDRHMAHSFTLEADGVGAGRRSRWRMASLGIDPAVIDSFPTFVYSEVKDLKIGKGALECAVCLNEFEDDETLRLLPKCSHVFHPDCIDAWLSSHVTCPVCRADLVPIPGETYSFSVPSQDPEVGESDSVFSPDIRELDPQNVNLDRLGDDSIEVIQSPEVIKNCPPRSTSRKERIVEKIRRSFSTGQVLVRPGDNCERFTLRLSEEARNRLVSASLSRTKSCQVLPSARSSRKGYRSSSSGGTGWGRNFIYERFTMTPPGFSRTVSVQSPKTVGGSEESMAAQKTSFKSFRSPLNRLFGATASRREDINVEERSSDRLV